MWPLIRIYSLKLGRSKQLLVTLAPEISGHIEDLGLTLARYLNTVQYSSASVMATDLILYLNRSQTVHIVTDREASYVYDVYLIDEEGLTLLSFDQIDFIDKQGVKGNLFLGPASRFLQKFEPTFD